MPTLLVSDTFESYALGAQVGAPWINVSNTMVFNAQAHGGTKSLVAGKTGVTSNATLPLGATVNSWTLDVWLWINAVGATAAQQYIGLRPASSSVGIMLGIGQTGAGQVFAPGATPTVFFTFTGVTTGVWHHCVLTVAQAATGGTIALTIDGTSVGTFTGDTRDTAGNAVVGEIIVQGAGIGPSPAAEFYVDDLFAYNNAAVAPTELRASQLAAEAWTASSPTLRASQVVAETWVPNTALQDSQVVAETWTTPSPELRASQVTVEEWLAVTGLRASQDLVETWTTDVAELRASQLLAEVWAQLQPPTALRASQLLAEVWTTDVPIALVASQDLAEVWLRPGVAVGYRRHNVSAHVTRSP